MHISVSRYSGIIRRCYDPTDRAYHRYGGRGIKVHSDIGSPEKFIDYISRLPGFGTPGLSLDRIDNDAGYAPGNLRWATSEEQANNKSGSKPNPHKALIYKGNTLPLLGKIMSDVYYKPGTYFKAVDLECPVCLQARMVQLPYIFKALEKGCEMPCKRCAPKTAVRAARKTPAVNAACAGYKRKRQWDEAETIIADYAVRRRWLAVYRQMNRGYLSVDLPKPWVSEEAFLYWVASQPEHTDNSSLITPIQSTADLADYKIVISGRVSPHTTHKKARLLYKGLWYTPGEFARRFTPKFSETRTGCLLASRTPDQVVDYYSWNEMGRPAGTSPKATMLPGKVVLEDAPDWMLFRGVKTRQAYLEAAKLAVEEAAKPVVLDPTPKAVTVLPDPTPPGTVLYGFEVLAGPLKRTKDCIKVPCKCVACGSTVYQGRAKLLKGTGLTKCLTCLNKAQKEAALAAK
jgi:hypothetical protein